MKKAFAIIMALVLVFSLSISAFAASNGTITITNATVGETYKVYKIFDATYSANGDKVSYSITEENPFFEALFGDEGTADGYFVYDATTGVVTKDPEVTDSDLFTYLSGLVAGATATQTSDPATSEEVKFEGLEPGYYVIKRNNNQTNAVTITTAKPDATVIDKNQVPGQLNKDADKDSVSVGETIEWEVTFIATNYDGEKKVEVYTIKDTLSSDWASYNFDAGNTTNITVEVGDRTLTAGTDYTLTMTNVNDKPGFEIEIPWMDAGAFKYDATEEVTITYSATVTENAVSSDLSVDLENKAELDWNYQGGGVGDGGDDDTDSSIHNMGFTKVDDKGNTLEGVKFELYKENGTDKVMLSGGANGIYTVDPDSTSNEIVTPAGGQVVIMGLAAGKYVLKETETLDGYNKLGAPVTVEVGLGGADYITIDTTDDGVDNGTTYTLSNNELNIENKQGIEMPETGGKGTIMMITFGTMIAIGFAVLLITQKKMTIYND